MRIGAREAARPDNTNTTTVAVLGARGYGREHLKGLAGLRQEDLAEVVAVVDPRGVDGVPNIPEAARVFASIDDMLAEVVPDVITVATPIHTHVPLASQAMRAGADVLVEKPTAATLAEFHELVQITEQTGRACQVGFQSFGSHALPDIAHRIAEGQIGAVRGIGGVGTWLRSTDYYDRASWAGRRRLDGREVVDGVVTNPLAHAVATGLHIADATRAEDVVEVVTDLWRAHDIEADDTSAVRIHTTSGLNLSFGLTLVASTQTSPTITVYGESGELELSYTRDELTVRLTGQEPETIAFGKSGLIRNLIEHRTTGVPLLASVERTGSFMRVLEAVRTAPDPAPIGPEHLTWLEDEHGRHPVVADVEAWCEQVARTGQTFTELGAPWTRSTA